MSYDAETVMAYVDGELDLIAVRRIEKAMEEDEALAAQVAAQRALKARLANRFDPIADEAVPDRLAALLNNVDTSFAGRRQARDEKRRAFGVMQWGAVAASLALGIMVGQFNFGGTGAGIEERNGSLIAQGVLESALQTQLASAQPQGAATRIGLTFRDKAGSVCRTFEGRDVSGIACRDAGGWTLRRTLSGGGQGSAYRQAGSGELAEAAASMMAGDAFDAQAERAALANNWR